jgi:hypothetical protein
MILQIAPEPTDEDDDDDGEIVDPDAEDGVEAPAADGAAEESAEPADA